MGTYYVDSRTGEVHKANGCHKEMASTWKYMDTFLTMKSAIAMAKKKGYKKAKACWYCSRS